VKESREVPMKTDDTKYAISTAPQNEEITNNEQVWAEELAKDVEDNPYLPKREIAQRPANK